jgi:hypothetical protein
LKFLKMQSQIFMADIFECEPSKVQYL